LLSNDLHVYTSYCQQDFCILLRPPCWKSINFTKPSLQIPQFVSPRHKKSQHTIHFLTYHASCSITPLLLTDFCTIQMCTPNHILISAPLHFGIYCCRLHYTIYIICFMPYIYKQKVQNRPYYMMLMHWNTTTRYITTVNWRWRLPCHNFQCLLHGNTRIPLFFVAR
jgi:hypothetical protein